MTEIAAEPKAGDVLEDNTIVGYPTLLIPDINTKEGTKTWISFRANPNAGFQFVWYGLAFSYDVWYGAMHLGEICCDVWQTTDKKWVGRWGRKLNCSPHYESPVQAAQWLLAEGLTARIRRIDHPPIGP